MRVFEWNGTMLHAKTAVADGVWARVGSTNLNLASWMGNYELDVAIEDAAFARAMAAQYETDLAHATEIVLTRRNRVRPRRDGSADARRTRARAPSGSAGRAAAGAVSVGSALGAALTNRRTLGPAESGLLVKVASCCDRARDRRGALAARGRVAARGARRRGSASRGSRRRCAAAAARERAQAAGRVPARPERADGGEAELA